MRGIGRVQLKTLIKARKYLKKFNSFKFNSEKNNIFYLSPFYNSSGLFKLRELSNSNLFKNEGFFAILKDILFSTYYSNNYCHHKLKHFSFSRIIISWGKKSDFSKDGVFNDKYFNISSKYKNSSYLWYLIYIDNQLPKKITHNVIIFQPIKYKLFNPIVLIKNFLINLNFFFLSHDYLLTSLTSQAFLSKLTIKNFLNLNLSKVKIVNIPYEGQPFQNELIRVIKGINPNAKIIGYMHAPPLPVPANLIKKSFSPDKIIVNGSDQKKLFKKYLGWKKEKIIIKPSSRFRYNGNLKKNFIYLPVNIKQLNNIKKILIILHNKKMINLKNFKIKKHPSSIGEHHAENLITDFKTIKKQLKINKNIKFKNPLIFVGSTGGIIEALEKNLSVIHLSEEPIFDLYSEEIWPNISSIQIYKNVYIYKLKKRGQMLKLGEKKTRYF